MTEITHRVLVPLVRKGGVGKSTTMSTIADWLTTNGVDWSGYDLDDEQRTFMTYNADRVRILPADERRQTQLMWILGEAEKHAVTLVDPKAHQYEELLDVLRLMAKAEERVLADGVRITVLLFPADEEQRLSDIQGTVAALMDTVDYLVVDNTQVHREKLVFFEQAALLENLMSLAARHIKLPSLWETTKKCMAIASEDIGRPLGFLEASRTKQMETFHRLFLARWLQMLFAEYKQAQTVLLPDGLKIAELEDHQPTQRQERKFRFARQ
ncbi:division plane positioning ATPase MipZ [Verrucomicrobium sp. 3C]|uniref:division plane positioning ATPase MipZ n=1 Tax=Verrucomicrobium sp. 3C TaxID=1134055 RepID=UPI0018CAE46D|nr:division plane positioning ATPase MipZ [Verrucomicrobium sp. 3C]